MIRESALWRGIAEEALKCYEAELGREQVSGESMAADPVGVGAATFSAFSSLAAKVSSAADCARTALPHLQTRG